MENEVMIKKLEIYLYYSWPFISVGSTGMNSTGLKTIQKKKKFSRKFQKAILEFAVHRQLFYIALTLY